MENMLQQKDSVVSPSYLNLLAKSFHENLSRETFNPLSPSPIKKKWSTNCLSVFDHFVWLALKGLRSREYMTYIKFWTQKI